MTTIMDDDRIVRGMRAQLAMRRKRIDAGETPLGWKVGFGAPAALIRLGLSAPLVGFLMQKARVESGANVSLKGWTKPVAEPEIAAHIGQDVAGGGSRDAAQRAIAALGPAIELADMDIPPDDVEAILAGDIFQRHAILGPSSTVFAGAKLHALTGHVFRRGAEVAKTSDLEASTGKVIDIVRHVADVLAMFGEGLRAGDVIICGSVVAPVFIEPDDDSFGFALEPVGTAFVRLAH